MVTKELPEGTNKKSNKLHRLFLNLGKLFLDIAKLCFASLVLGTMIRGDFSHSALLSVGIIASGAGAIVGIIFVTIS